MADCHSIRKTRFCKDTSWFLAEVTFPAGSFVENQGLAISLRWKPGVCDTLLRDH